MQCTILDIDLGPDVLKVILQHGGVESWNQWINDLADTGILNPECSRDSDPAMLVGFDLSHADLAGLVMPGIDLSWCHIAHASFRGCDLTGAKIAADITRVDFTDNPSHNTSVMINWLGGARSDAYSPSGRPS